MFYHYFNVKILTNEGKGSRSMKQLVSLITWPCLCFIPAWTNISTCESYCNQWIWKKLLVWSTI